MGEKTKKLESLAMLSGSKRYKEQLEDVAHDREVDKELKDESVDTPGSDAYIRRRDRQAAEDLKNNPRKGR